MLFATNYDFDSMIYLEINLFGDVLQSFIFLSVFIKVIIATFFSKTKVHKTFIWLRLVKHSACNHCSKGEIVESDKYFLIDAFKTVTFDDHLSPIFKVYHLKLQLPIRQ